MDPVGNVSLRQTNRIEDLLVTGASTKVAGQRFPDGVLGGMRIPLQEIGDRHDQTWGAEPTLDRPRFHESSLNRMQRAALRGQVLLRPHVPIVSLQAEHQTGTHHLAIEPDRTGSALPLFASVLRAREAEVVSKNGEKARARPHVGLAPLPVDSGAEEHQWTPPSGRRSANAHRSARPAMTPQARRRYAAVPRTSSMGRASAATNSANRSTTGSSNRPPASSHDRWD